MGAHYSINAMASKFLHLLDTTITKIQNFIEHIWISTG
jgi:hypothetical protein